MGAVDVEWAVLRRAPRNADAFDLGVQTLEAAPGEPVKIYSPVRTVVDLIRLRTRMREPLAHIDLRRYLARRDARVGQLIDLARALDILGPVRAAVDVLTAS